MGGGCEGTPSTAHFPCEGIPFTAPSPCEGVPPTWGKEGVREGNPFTREGGCEGSPFTSALPCAGIPFTAHPLWRDSLHMGRGGGYVKGKRAQVEKGPESASSRALREGFRMAPSGPNHHVRRGRTAEFGPTGHVRPGRTSDCGPLWAPKAKAPNPRREEPSRGVRSRLAGPLLGPPRTEFGVMPARALFGSSWGPLGTLLGASWGRLWALLEPSRGVRSRLAGPLGPPRQTPSDGVWRDAC